jgi:hypothetical protein
MSHEPSAARSKTPPSTPTSTRRAVFSWRERTVRYASVFVSSSRASTAQPSSCCSLRGSVWTPVRNCCTSGSEGPIRRTREGGSECESIKILLEGDRGSNKMNTASNTRLRLTTQVGQDHAATRVLLALGTNNQLMDPRTQRNTNSSLTDLHRSGR